MTRYRDSLHKYKSSKRGRMKCMNDSEEIQDTESDYSVNFSHVPSQPAVTPSPRFFFFFTKPRQTLAT